MLQVPLQAVPNQTLSTILANQNCRINVYQRQENLFFDLYTDDQLVVGGVICQNMNRLVRDSYFGFVGDFGFYDVMGSDDPSYEGLSSRFLLLYLEASDLNGVG